MSIAKFALLLCAAVLFASFAGATLGYLTQDIAATVFFSCVTAAGLVYPIARRFWSDRL